MNSSQNENHYSAPKGIRIGHIHLKVSYLDRSLNFFYSGLLGFKLTQCYGNEAVFLAADKYHHHIGLNIGYSKGTKAEPQEAPGLFHSAFLYPKRKDLAQIYSRLLEFGYPISGAADHGVSKAMYRDDTDGNGVELYWDKPYARWPRLSDGRLNMYTHPLNLQ